MNFSVNKKKEEAPLNPTNSAKVVFFEDSSGIVVSEAVTNFGVYNKVIATQTGYNPDNKKYYAFVWYKK